MERWKHKFEIKKERWVYVPSDEMSDFGKRLHKHIIAKWRVPLYYYHMRDGGHVAAARAHIHNDYFALIDIRNFFESTSQSRVTRELKTIFSYEDARKIAKISTVRIPNRKGAKFAIPYGFPQSPVLATLCLHNSYAGRVLDSIYKSGVANVSIFMDDIIISSKSLAVLVDKFEELCGALIKSRYELNERKTQRPSGEVTVFNLELANNHLKVTSQRLVEFIQAYAQSQNEYERVGIAAYVHTVSPAQANLHFPKQD